MTEVIDPSHFTRLRDGVLKDSAEGYFIEDIKTIKAEFEGKIQQINTREMKLETLGVFPLPTESLPLLKAGHTYAGIKLQVPPLFLQSQIPIYADTAGKYAYIPQAGANICRYFYELWRLSETEDNADGDDVLLGGFAVLLSYAGI